ncbi:uncharacterized protein LOC108329042 isoform X1 [Vigna angularis]|uniref:uncharacterized protein LOC108329042 isoform X1 n=1 Tax=Phaseolus angularis TaxID=3914 RepID=UPI0022B48074|nr:uncharacterized protein LOC108329042 isoform X1 [Vigna angularis]
MAGLKVQPSSFDLPVQSRRRRSEVAMTDLDPRTNTDDRIEPMGEIKPFSLGQKKEQVTTIRSGLDENQTIMIGTLLKMNQDLFAWTAADMPGIHPRVMSHKLALFKESRPVAQKKRRLGEEKRSAVEVKKLLEADFIREIKYTTWLANVVMVKKMSGQWRMCTDFTDLNKACPKDSYPLPSIDGLVDGASGFHMLSFLDAYSGYNQIPMFPPDSDKTTLITERANYCYDVMPFGLKNAGATYQRLMDRVFADQIGRCMEVYVDDMVVRSRSVEDHVRDLEEVFRQVRKYNMRLNPTKCTFGVPSGKFLGFMLTTRDIEVNPDKCRTVLEMRSPQKLKEVQRLVGRLTSLSRFIPRLAERIKPILKVMKRSTGVDWDDQCEQAFDEVKRILVSPPVMGRPEAGHALQLFLAVSDDTVSSALVQEQPEFKLVYFVSRTLQPVETRYKRVEKIALALVMAARRLRPYFQSHQVVVRTDHPIAKILRKPDLAGRIVGWSVELSEFGLQYEPRGSVRGQHLADFAVELPGEEVHPEWILYVDGSSEKSCGGARIVLEGPDDFVVEQAIIFRFKISNNQAEYEVVLAGLELAKDLGAVSIKCRTDSQLVVGQLTESFQTKDDQLLRYFHKVKELVKQFRTVEFKHVPREQNARADVLSKLANSKGKGHLSSVIRQVMISPSVECLAVNEISTMPDWRKDIREIIQRQESGERVRAPDLKKAARYLLIGEDLYKRGFSCPLLKCLSSEEAEYVMRELHEGACGMHTGQRALRARVIRAGYFWPTVERDCKEFVKKCLKCQEHGRNLNLPPVELHSLMSPWPFAQWGVDIVGPLPVGRAQKKFLLVAIDYFTKWVEAEPLATITAARAQKFMWTLICRFGIPKVIVTDNGRQFIDKGLGEFYRKLEIKHVTSSVEHPQTNGQVEAVNKVIVSELKKRLGEAKGLWVDELQEVLWGYRCTPHGTTGETPFNLTYGIDAMLPVEVGEPTVRREVEGLLDNNRELRLELDTLDERREVALIRAEAKRRLLARRYNTKVMPRQFAEGDLVWRKTAEA